MIVKLLTEHHFEFLSLKGDCRGSSASTHVKMTHCWKSHATAQMFLGNSIAPLFHLVVYPVFFIGICQLNYKFYSSLIHQT